LAAGALGVPPAVVRAALRTAAAPALEADPALVVLLPQLPALVLRRAHAGRPYVLHFEATADVAFGEGVSVGEQLDGQVILKKGDRLRAGLFRARRRIARTAQFTVTVPADPSAYSLVFLVLLAEDEQRVWTANTTELLHARDTLAAGEPWQRIRLLESGSLRFELPKSRSDWDLDYRMGPPPRRARRA
jgi:hypothetical protein